MAGNPQFGRGQPKRFAGKKGRSGAPQGNKNALRNGSRVGLNRLVIGETAKEMLSVRREGRAYRRLLEAEVVRVKGGVNLVDAHLIDTATACTVRAAIARWCMKHRLDKMTVGDIDRNQNAQLSAKSLRDKSVIMLDLEAQPESPWAVIDAPSEANGDDDND